jgi:putative ABC transport system permease protein
MRMKPVTRESRETLVRLAREWPFSLTATLTLALGMGVILAASWIFYTTFVEPLPYLQGSRLVSLSLTMPGNSGMTHPMSQVAYRRFRNGAGALADSAFYFRKGENLDLGGRAIRVTGVETTGSLFSTLGVKPLLGRVFGDRADEPGQPHVVVLGNRIWRDDFGGRPNVIGQNLELNQTAYTVIGIMPRGFRFPVRGVDFWEPYPLISYNYHYFQLTAFRGHMIGRLAPGQSLATLNTEVRTLTTGLIHRFPPSARQFFRHFSARAEGWRTSRTGHLQLMLTLIEISSLLLLALVWFNLGNLFIARGITQRGELLLRSVLGASPRDFLLRHALEATTIGLLATLTGWLLAQGLLVWIQSLRVLPEVTSLTRNTPVLAILILAVGGGSILVMTLVPLALSIRRDPSLNLRDAGSRSGGSPGAARARRGLVTVQIALATTLAGVSLLLTHTLFNLASVEPGFRTQHIMAFDIDLAANASTPSNPWATLERLGRAIRQIPGVNDAGISSGLPFGLGGSDVNALFQEPWNSHDPMLGAYIRVTDSRFLKILGLDPLRGRLFTPLDIRSKAGVAVIDRLAARQLYGIRDPIGRIFTLNSPNNRNPALRFRVVGLVHTVRNKHLGRQPQTGNVYLDAPQALLLSGHSGWYHFSRWVFVIRSPLPAGLLRGDLSQTLHRILPGLPLYHFRTLQARLDRRLRSRQTLLGLVSLFAFGSLLLTVVGLYGVESYLVSQRLREFGIRGALGADRPALIRLVLGESARLFLAGMIPGLIGMLLVGHLFSTLLYGVAPDDGASIAILLVVFALVFLLATWIPTRRVGRLDPSLLLHTE